AGRRRLEHRSGGRARGTGKSPRGSRRARFNCHTSGNGVAHDAGDRTGTRTREEPMTRLRIAAVALAILLGGRGLAAQGDAPRMIDRILAIVGGRAILESQIDERIVMMQAQGQTVPQDSAGIAALKKQMLQEMIDEELLVQQAEHDTAINVPETEVQSQVDQTVNNVRGQFPSEAEFQAETRKAGFASVEEWRRYLAENQRRTILGQ